MSTPNPCFNVFGEPVEILVSSQQTGGSFCIITQTCQPGGGPPPHSHSNDDEIFTTIEGEFELFDGTAWHPLRKGEVLRGTRGGVHTFRNSGSEVGKILIIASPGGLDRYLVEIAPLVMPQDAEKLFAISAPYGITFPPQN